MSRDAESNLNFGDLRARSAGGAREDSPWLREILGDRIPAVSRSSPKAEGGQMKAYITFTALEGPVKDLDQLTKDVDSVKHGTVKRPTDGDAENRREVTKEILRLGSKSDDADERNKLRLLLTDLYKNCPVDEDRRVFDILKKNNLIKDTQVGALPSKENFQSALDILERRKLNVPDQPGQVRLPPATSKEEANKILDEALKITDANPQEQARKRREQLQRVADYYDAQLAELPQDGILPKDMLQLYYKLSHPGDVNNPEIIKNLKAEVNEVNPLQFKSLANKYLQLEQLILSLKNENEENRKTIIKAYIKRFPDKYADPKIKKVVDDFLAMDKVGDVDVEAFVLNHARKILFPDSTGTTPGPQPEPGWFSKAWGWIGEHPGISIPGGVLTVAGLGTLVYKFPALPFKAAEGVGWLIGYGPGYAKDLAKSGWKGLADGFNSKRGRGGPASPFVPNDMRPDENFEEYLKRKVKEAEEKKDAPSYERKDKEGTEDPNVKPSPEAMREAKADLDAVYEEARRIAADIPNARETLADNPAAVEQLLKTAKANVEKKRGKALDKVADAELTRLMDSQGKQGATRATLLSDITPSGESKGAAAEAPVRGDGPTPVGDLKRTHYEVDPKTSTVKTEVLVFGERNPLDEPDLHEQVRRQLDKQCEELRSLKEPTEEQKERLRHLESTRHKWASKDAKVCGEFLRGEIEAGRIEVKLGERGRGGGATGTLVGLGIVITAVGLWVLPEKKQQGRPIGPNYR